MVREYAASTGFPWTYAMGDEPTLERLNVTTRDTKFAVDRRGVIVYQAGFGGVEPETWRSIFEDLVKG